MSMGRFLVLVFAAVSFIVGVPRILGEFREDLARWSSMLAEWQWWNFALVATSLACAGYVLWPIISRLSGINIKKVAASLWATLDTKVGKEATLGGVIMAMSIGIPLIVVTFVVMMFLIGVSGWIAIGLAVSLIRFGGRFSYAA